METELFKAIGPDTVKNSIKEIIEKLETMTFKTYKFEQTRRGFIFTGTVDDGRVIKMSYEEQGVPIGGGALKTVE